MNKERLKNMIGKVVTRFERKDYLVLGTALHTETNEELVIYKELHDNCKVCAIPIEIFLNELNKDVYLDMKQRQKEGIDRTKALGKHLGRPRAIYPDNWNEIYPKWKNGEIKAVEAMRLMGLKKATFYRLVKRFED